MPSDDGYPHTTGAAFDGSQERQSMLQGGATRTCADSRWLDAVPPVGQTTADPGSFKGGTTQPRRGVDTAHRNQKHDGRSDDDHQVPLPQEAQGPRGCLHQDDGMADGLLKQSSSSSVAQLEETLLSFYLAAHRGQMPQLHTGKKPVSNADLQAVEMTAVGDQHEAILCWKVIRIMRNPGVLCYANCIFQSLCWMALYTG